MNFARKFITLLHQITLLLGLIPFFVSDLHGSCPDLSLYSATQFYDSIINLGDDCQVAYQMYVNGLRKCALPFDHLMTSYDSLYEMLENNFDGFLARTNFEFTINEMGEKYILDKKYGTRLIHDFKLQADFLNDYEEIAAKYIRRIDRLLNLMRISKYPLFLRKGINKEQALKLRNLLSALREERPFLLVALDNTQEIESDWHVDNIRNYYLRKPKHTTWQGDSKAWKEIFYSLGFGLSMLTQINNVPVFANELSFYSILPE